VVAVLGPEPPDFADASAPKAPEQPEQPQPAAPKAPAGAKAPMLVEYLNAFCSHCRETHKRLHTVLDETGVTVRRRRVYTWGGQRTPEWARACAFAATCGVEDRMFEELLKAKRQTRGEIEAAARRAGLSVRGLNAFLRRGGMPDRLERDRQLFQKSGIRQLPTIDIGRRRLMGAQTAPELRAALLAAAGRD
jgi:predicted DsbA family dithiol-disulfide isomerase